MSLYNKEEILKFIETYKLPLEPISGILVYVLTNPEKEGDLFLPTAYKASAIRSGDVLKAVVVSDPLNCEEEPSIKKGVTVMFKAASGAALNINGHQFHKLELPDILAIVDEDE